MVSARPAEKHELVLEYAEAGGSRVYACKDILAVRVKGVEIAAAYIAAAAPERVVREECELGVVLRKEYWRGVLL